MNNESEIERRKIQHLDVCLAQDVWSGRSSGLDQYMLEYDALPELDLDQVDLSCEIFGKRLEAPIIIASMTGGAKRAGELNVTLAKVAARLGLGMVVGSQRAMIEDTSLAATYAVRQAAPDLPLLLGNIGATQIGSDIETPALRASLVAIDADGLTVHLNPLQEALQSEGSANFTGVHQRLAQVVAELEYPVLVKEVGSGLSAVTAAKLASLPIAGVDVAGVGGTSWIRVEGLRAPRDSLSAKLGERLAGFGVPTAQSLVACRRVFGERVVVASGGIRTGHDAAVALALGADAVSLARPMLVAAAAGEAELEAELRLIIEELRLLCFATGAQNVAELRRTRLLDRHGLQVENW